MIAAKAELEKDGGGGSVGKVEKIMMQKKW